MALSEDLSELEMYVDLARLGQLVVPLDLERLRVALAHFADRAAELERTLRDTAAQLSPSREHAAVLAGIAAGKVELLAAHRVRRLPDLPRPGWTA